METFDDEISGLDLKIPKNLSRLIVKYLCNCEYDETLYKSDEASLSHFITNAQKNKMDFRQFNELLLLLNQDVVRKDFFDFFFEKNMIDLEDLKKGVIKFRAFAMLCFGNFRFAYKKLIQMNAEELKIQLSPYNRNPSALKNEFKSRPQKMLEIEKIDKDKTWFLGYISGKKVDKEIEFSGKENRTDVEFLQFTSELDNMSEEIQGIQSTALQNTNVYLTWDCMDVYFATSMRNKWEFEETYEFIEEVTGFSILKPFKLRYFDPTQSICENSREKGLIEGLMLRRALCTVYLAQESDTMGKDSELAATLAQSKPVIAYVPQHDPHDYSEKIRDFPLSFFHKRLLIHQAEESFEEILRDPHWSEKIVKFDSQFRTTISDFLDEYEKYRCEQPYELFFKKENEFKNTSKFFKKICMILAIIECYKFEKRADLLKGIHPLSMQVDLQTGVANGVLVVRNPKQCAELLFRIFTNNMIFEIKKEEKFYVLKEKMTGAPFRVVIENEKLTNSFWNLFFNH
jgi:hypothetical protein